MLKSLNSYLFYLQTLKFFILKATTDGRTKMNDQNLSGGSSKYLLKKKLRQSSRQKLNRVRSGKMFKTNTLQTTKDNTAK